MKDHQIDSNKIPLTLPHRILMAFCYATQLLLLLYFNLLMIHYTFKPIPLIFAASSLVQSQFTDTSYIFNALMYSLFFVQHVGMSLIIFKMSLQSLWSKYPLYQRYIYNISSSIVQIIIFNLVRPVSSKETIILTTPILLNIILSLLAVVTLIMSIFKLGDTILNPFSIRDILSVQSLEVHPYNKISNLKLTNTGLYAFCRHPMQASIVMLLIFSSNIYTVDRVIFILVNIMGILIAISYQQKKLRLKFKNYVQYQKKVPYKFIPYLL